MKITTSPASAAIAGRKAWQACTRRFAAASLLAVLLAACGGGSSSGGDDAGGGAGTREFRTIASRATGTAYPLSIYLPPASAGPRASLPVLYVLDGESWFETLVRRAQADDGRFIVVAIHGAGQRSRDYVPLNTCTPAGGGHANYLAFVRDELIPSIESTVGGDPRQRALFGHSHGGSFVFYALFAQAPGRHTFSTYLASDASVSCMADTAARWEADYAAAHRDLPVRLHISYATSGNHDANQAYAGVVARRAYRGLDLIAKAYGGTHNGIVPAVLEEGVAFAFGAGP